MSTPPPPDNLTGNELTVWNHYTNFISALIEYGGLAGLDSPANLRGDLCTCAALLTLATVQLP